MKCRIIVSLTSYPKRIVGVSRVIKSLFEQTIKADKIILWLSLLEFPEKEQSLPLDLISLKGTQAFQIHWVKENLKSHKKYYYALQKYKKDIVITVDDDIYYSITMIQELLEAYYQFPNAIVARNVRMILRQNNEIANYDMWGNCDRYILSRRHDLCAIGWGGILYPPHIVNDRWFDRFAIENNCPYQDDLWLKFNEILDGIPVVYAGKKKEDIIILDAQECALYEDNIMGNQNNVSINKLNIWARENDNEVIEHWLANLSDSISFYLQRKEEQALYLIETLKKRKQKVYICGAGKYAKVLLELFEEINKSDMISGLVVSSYEGNPKDIDKIPIFSIDDAPISKNTLIICGVSSKNRQILKPYFDNKQCEWLDLDLDSISRFFKILNGNGEKLCQISD